MKKTIKINQNHHENDLKMLTILSDLELEFIKGGAAASCLSATIYVYDHYLKRQVPVLETPPGCQPAD